LTACGWKIAYERPYAHRTRDTDLDTSVPPEARYVLAGARREGYAAGSTTKLDMVAWGPREVVLAVTHDENGFDGGFTTSENEYAGVYWYRWPDHSFGFSTCPNLLLQYADASPAFGYPEEGSDDRLSWNLDLVSTGGWRAGTVLNLGRSTRWTKVLMYHH
jgi:hypothetical protein